MKLGLSRNHILSAQSKVAEHGPAANSPTHVRYHIIGLLAVVSALTYLDRLNLSIAGKYIQDEFAFSTETMGWVLSAFVWGYALFQIVGGWLGDRHGPRRVLTAAILWWSVFTGGTAVAPRLPLAAWLGFPASFAILRFMVGVGEASTFPNSNKIVAYWMGHTQRALGNSLPFVGIGVGGSATPMLIAWVMQRWGWPTAFYVCGMLGVVVALTWYGYAMDRPEQHSGVNAAELAMIRSSRGVNQLSGAREDSFEANPPWKQMLSSRSVWALLSSAFCIGYAAYIFYTWFYIYLVRVRGLTVTQGGVWGSAPFLAIAILAPLGGWFSDRAVERFGYRRGRQAALWLGVLCSGATLWLGGHAVSTRAAIILLGLAAGFNLFATATVWAVCIDLAPTFSGSLSGLMNTLGTLGGAVSPILTAHIATHWGWPQALDCATLLMLIAGLLWIMVNADENVEQRSPASRPSPL
jgi:ACS family glucarate transporter-like MFS transporter